MTREIAAIDATTDLLLTMRIEVSSMPATMNHQRFDLGSVPIKARRDRPLITRVILISNLVSLRRKSGAVEAEGLSAIKLSCSPRGL
jgi:hypothetical protein